MVVNQVNLNYQSSSSKCPHRTLGEATYNQMQGNMVLGRNVGAHKSKLRGTAENGQKQTSDYRLFIIATLSQKVPSVTTNESKLQVLTEITTFYSRANT